MSILSITSGGPESHYLASRRHAKLINDHDVYVYPSKCVARTSALPAAHTCSNWYNSAVFVSLYFLHILNMHNDIVLVSVCAVTFTLSAVVAAFGLHVSVCACAAALCCGMADIVMSLSLSVDSLFTFCFCFFVFVLGYNTHTYTNTGFCWLVWVTDDKCFMIEHIWQGSEHIIRRAFPASHPCHLFTH